MDFKYLLIGGIGLFGLGAITIYPLYDKLHYINDAISSTTTAPVNEIKQKAEVKLNELNQNYAVEGCWSNIQTLVQDGLWYNQPLSNSVQQIKEACLGAQPQEQVPTLET